MLPDTLTYAAYLSQWVNVFIAFFIIIFASFFFFKTKPREERTPWVLLFIAVIFFFLFELSGAVFKSLHRVPELIDFFKTLFIAFILYVFIYQNYLVSQHGQLVIEKKESKSKPESAKPVPDTKKLNKK
jgi:hypothetical protein